ncbi:MAG: LytTR family DNA-binding domain-containing protein, partial [Rhodothermales bacterium]
LEERDDVTLADSVGNGLDAVASIRELQPDIVLLDVQMPGLSGIEVVRKIDPSDMPVVIFVTAYQQHALDAFEVSALDYLLKPFDEERFHEAMNRAKDMVGMRHLVRLRDRLTAFFDARPPRASDSHAGSTRYLNRIAVEMRGQIKVLSVESIDYISASGPYAELHVGEEKYVIREQMQDLENQLDPEHFFRIHRSTIVRLDCIDAMFVKSGSKYAVRLKPGTYLRVSRNRWDKLSARLGTQPLRRGGQDL